MNTILCPFCGKTVEISHALEAALEEKIALREKEKFALEREKIKNESAQESSKKVREQFELQLEQLKTDAVEEKKRNQQLLTELTKITQELRESKRAKEEAQLDMQKKLMQEEGKIREEEQKKAQEEQHLKILEKEKQLQDAFKANEELRRKLMQGSQQTQGEAFEIVFEEELSRHYPNDKILPVGKGMKGGDIIHEVWDSRGNFIGKIIWELKNTKTWSEGWVDKLKNDKRVSNCEEAVLITEVLPTMIKIAGFHDGIWITGREFVFPLADTLRAKLIQLYYVKNSVLAKDEKMEILYSYLSGTEFTHRIEAIIESFSHMQEEIEKEKRYFSNKWARDEKNIRQVIDNTYGMHGDLKAIVGSAIPLVKGIDLLDDGN